MKTVVTKIAVGSSVMTFVIVLLCTYTNTLQQKENVVATPIHSFPHFPKTKAETEVFEEVFFRTIPEGEFFPEIQNRELSIENSTEVTTGVYCPFISEENNVVIDFTKKGTIPLPSLIMYADRGAEDAVRIVENISIQPGVYTVHLASFFNEDGEVSSELGLEQQWYLELYSQEGDVLSTTKATRDMQNSEVRSIELVEHALVVPEKAFIAHAVHFAYKDTEAQKIAPVCAVLTVVDEGEEDRESILSASDTSLFTASALLQNNTEHSKTARALFTVFALISVLFALLSMAVFSMLHREKN